jgi:hypothetical protein
MTEHDALTAELLEALKAMVARWEPDTEGADRRMWEAACAAIQKATGNTFCGNGCGKDAETVRGEPR